MSWRNSVGNSIKKSKLLFPVCLLLIGDARIELATSTMSTWHSPAELTAHSTRGIILEYFETV